MSTTSTPLQDDTRMSLMEHLTELRDRIIKVVLAVVVGMVISFLLYDWIFDFLLEPYESIANNRSSLTDGRLLQVDPLEGFGVRMKLAAYGGIAIAMPVILWQIWRFVTPGLYPHEKRYAVPFLVSALSLFVLGAGLAYTTLPRALEFLVDIGGSDNFVTAFQPAKYFTLITYMMLAFGIGFEFPILLVFLQMAGIVTPDALRSWRRYAVVGICILVAVITPSGDPISMLMLSLPMVLFYEAAIVIGRLMERRKRRAAAAGRVMAEGFTLDPFQVRAISVLDAGRSVLVAAPTGSGKTVVAEHAVAKALAEGGKAFYTAPIKALSNQKYADLARIHGPSRVGLLTGDNAINGDAPAVVMTTEVLRNMIYAGSPALRDLRYVVLDEVHFLQDAYRGPVWEEVMIHLDPTVRLVCLSATVSNAEELAEWIGTVRGPTEAVIEERRPVELRNLYCVGDKQSQELHLLPTLVDGKPNPEADRLDDEALRSRGGSPRGRPRRRFFTPRRVEVIERLAEEDMLPCITFIFSRAACDDARDACVDAGLRLTTVEERARIRTIVDERTAALADADLDVLGFDGFLAGLEMGIAAHHAGMVPPFKEAVEACFVEGLTKAVFATETLAMGINMPARSVVIERLTKFTGEKREMLTPGEYTQLTGRAGRRGIDELGYALVLWSPFVPFEQVAALASSRTYALRSAFRPTYNMACNLVRRYEPAQAHHLLNLSFAQFQADRAVVVLEQRIERQQQRLARLSEEASCERGDVVEYRALRQAAEQAQRSRPRPDRLDGVGSALAALSPGDVVVLGGTRHAVLSVAFRKGNPRLHTVDERGAPHTYSHSDLDASPEAIGQIDLPVPYNPNNRAFQHQVGDALRRRRLAPARRPRTRDEPKPRAATDEVDEAVRAANTHPVADCPDRDAHLRAVVQIERVERELADLRRQVRGRTGSLARRFDRVLRLLEAWGYLDGWALTEAGTVLARTYHEADLLVAEAMTSGVLDDLDAPSLAAIVSCFTYEHRGREQPPDPRFPSSTIRERFHELQITAGRLVADEEEAGLPTTRLPDAGFVHLAHAWAAGEGLSELLEDELLSGGDFVRNVKQLIDLLRGIGDVAPVPATAARARQAAEALHRGVVSAASALEAPDGPDEANGDDPAG